MTVEQLMAVLATLPKNEPVYVSGPGGMLVDAVARRYGFIVDGPDEDKFVVIEAA